MGLQIKIDVIVVVVVVVAVVVFEHLTPFFCRILVTEGKQ